MSARDALEALGGTVLLLAALVAAGWIVLYLVDRLRPGEKRTRRLALTPKERGLLLGLLAAVVPVLILELAMPYVPPAVLLAGLGLVVAVMLVGFGRRTSRVDRRLELIADELGWVRGRFRRRRFSVVPEERVVREWDGRRAGLTVREPGPHDEDGALVVTLTLPPDAVDSPSFLRSPHRSQPGGPAVVVDGRQLRVSVSLQGRMDEATLDARAREAWTLALAADRSVLGSGPPPPLSP
jgi:hypothetical protein